MNFTSPGSIGSCRGWSDLPQDLQLTLVWEALRRASEVIADQAQILATEMDAGTLRNEGGPEALRLLSEVIRAVHADGFQTVGTA